MLVEIDLAVIGCNNCTARTEPFDAVVFLFWTSSTLKLSHTHFQGHVLIVLNYLFWQCVCVFSHFKVLYNHFLQSYAKRKGTTDIYGCVQIHFIILPLEKNYKCINLHVFIYNKLNRQFISKPMV